LGGGFSGGGGGMAFLIGRKKGLGGIRSRGFGSETNS